MNLHSILHFPHFEFITLAYIFVLLFYLWYYLSQISFVLDHILGGQSFSQKMIRFKFFTPENTQKPKISGVFRGYEMKTSGRNGSISKVCFYKQAQRSVNRVHMSQIRFRSSKNKYLDLEYQLLYKFQEAFFVLYHTIKSDETISLVPCKAKI